MATRRRKSVAQTVSVATGVPLTLTIPVRKPRNRLAVDPLLKKSSAHADSRNKRVRDGKLEVQQDVHDALIRRRIGNDEGDDQGGAN